jgi:hypothetical protein
VTATSSYAAADGATIAIVLGGTAVPLSADQVLSGGITVSPDDTFFTVPNAGVYRLSYTVNTTADVLMSTQLLIDGTANTASILAPLISLSSYANEILVDLAAGSTVELQLFGLLGTVTLLSGAGATLMIVQLS